MFVDVDSIVLYGISDSYINKRAFFFRQGKSQSWENIKDPKDGRKILINYESIPQTTIRKYNMPATYADFVKHREQQITREQAEREASKTEFDRLQENPLYGILRNAIERDFIKYVDLYSDILDNSTKCKKNSIRKFAEEYAKKHAMYNVFIEDTGGAFRTVKGSVKRLFDFLNAYKKYECTPSYRIDYISFSRKLRDYKNDIAGGKPLHTTLVDPNRFNKSKQKTTDFHKGILLHYASNPKHYAIRQLAEFVNFHAVKENLCTISESWIKDRLNDRNDSTFRTLVDCGRLGAKYSNDYVLPYLSREASLYPHNTWFIDGTPLQMYYKDNSGNVRRLYLFVVLDACTRKIVGFDINTSGEDRFMVMNAIKMAIWNTQYIPFEIVSDNFSANKTEEIKELQKELQQTYGVLWRFAKIGNAQDKSYVERFNGTFQSMEQSLLEEYIGEGITSKRKNGRIDPDFIKEVVKKKGLYSAEKMMDFVSELICIYNNKQVSGRPSPNELCNSLAVDQAKEITFVQLAKLFWTKTIVKAQRGQITLQVKNKKYEFDIWDKDLTLKLQGKKVIVRYDETHLENVQIFDFYTDEFIKELRLKVKGYASSAEVPEDKKDIPAKHYAHKKSLQQYIEEKRQEIINKGLATVGQTIDDFNPVSALDLNKHHLQAKESVEMLGIYQIMKGREIFSLNKDYTEVAKNGTPSYPNTSTVEKSLKNNGVRTKKKEPQVYDPSATAN